MLGISTFCDWFQPIGMSPRDWWVGFPHLFTIVHITRNSVRVCLSLIVVRSVVMCGVGLSCSTWMCFVVQQFFVSYRNKLHCSLILEAIWEAILESIFTFVAGILQVLGRKYAYYIENEFRSSWLRYPPRFYQSKLITKMKTNCT
jgi:hypothetical protein